MRPDLEIYSVRLLLKHYVNERARYAPGSSFFAVSTRALLWLLKPARYERMNRLREHYRGRYYEDFLSVWNFLLEKPFVKVKFIQR